MNYYLTVLRKYAVFSGRARRAEYWYFILFNIIIVFGLYLIERLLRIPPTIPYNGGIPVLVYDLAVLIPGLAVFVRRLHDTNRSGWWWFLSFIPLVGAIILLIFLVEDSQPGENKYGPNPKGAITSGNSPSV